MKQLLRKNIKHLQLECLGELALLQRLFARLELQPGGLAVPPMSGVGVGGGAAEVVGHLRVPAQRP